MPGARLTALAAALAAGCALAAPAITPASTTAATQAPPTAKVGGPAAVAPTSTTQGFLGLATSFSTIAALEGTTTDPDVTFQHLLENLSPGAPVQLRLGGVSADTSWWAVPGMKPPRYLSTLTPRWAANFKALLTAVGGKTILGVNLEEDPDISQAIASAEVAGFNRYIGPNLIQAFELGNEPEYFPLFVVNGGRGHDTIAAYGKKFSQIAARLGGAPLAGPASVGKVWLSELGTVLSHLPSHLNVATVHLYPLKNCSLGAHPLLSRLLSSSSIQGLADSAHGMVKAAAAHGEPLRVDELNGITCGGKAGLSNSFGEALWALNVLPALWKAGVQGVNYQTVDGLLNQVITARHSASGWRVSVEPVYYGLLAFAEAAPAGSHLLNISSPGVAHVYQFAVRAPDGTERVVLTNVGAASRTIDVRVAGTHGSGSVSLLSGGSLTATGGTTLAGQTLSPQTGRLAGTPRATLVKPNHEGAYAVRVPAHAAAILTLSR
ncbi:MAG TPA: glycosyl hydrolase family 79 C-terminal domain-containing protein [Solirubrobacteraceae bacterium]|jgi:hypothetical protein